MILLPPGNRILGEVVAAQITLPAEEKHDAIDVKLCDFDDVSYHVVIAGDNREVMKVSINLPCFYQIADKGGKAALNRVYGDLVVEPETGFDATLSIDFTKVGDAKQQEELISKIQNFKVNLVGGVYDYFFTAVEEGRTEKEFKFDLRGDTTVYFAPRADAVTIVYSFDFQDKTDKAIAKVFMQEFVDAKRRMGQAPPIAWNTNPPRELAAFGVTENTTGVLGFMSIAVLKSHVDKGKKAQVVQTLQTFRNYIQYHIKCSKAYFHSRMRARVVELIKVLNRAKVVDPKADQTKKLASGKTFVRKE